KFLNRILVIVSLTIIYYFISNKTAIMLVFFGLGTWSMIFYSIFLIFFSLDERNHWTKKYSYFSYFLISFLLILISALFILSPYLPTFSSLFETDILPVYSNFIRRLFYG